MGKIISKLKKTSTNINEYEGMVYLINNEGNQCGAMKVNRSLLEEIDENKLYRINFSNYIMGYNNVATITAIEQVNEEETIANHNLFQVSGIVSDVKDFNNGRLITVSECDGKIIKGGAWNNNWSDSSAKNINVGSTVNLFAELATFTSDNYVRYNFFNSQTKQKEAVKKLVAKRYNVSDSAAKANTTKTIAAATTDATTEVKKAQDVMQKLVDKLIAKGWVVENTPQTPCTAIGFQATVNSTQNVVNIIDIRALETILKSDVLQEVSKKLFLLKKDVDVEYGICKKQLPALTSMATVKNKQRIKPNCTSNGLVFLDVDGIEYSLCEKILSYIKENQDINSKVLLWNISPSRKGFHLIFVPFEGVEQTIIANQHHICALINTALGCQISPDGQCFDISRAAFLTSEYWLGGASALLSADNPQVLPQLTEGVVYKPAAKKHTLLKAKDKKMANRIVSDNEYDNNDTFAEEYISYYICDDDLQTLKFFCKNNKYIEGNRHNWWLRLGATFRAKGHTKENNRVVEDIFEFAVDTVQRLPEYVATVDDPINDSEAFDAFMSAYHKENWVDYLAPQSSIADEDLPFALQSTTCVDDFVQQFVDYKDDMPRLFVNNSNTYFDEKKNTFLLPVHLVSTAALLTPYTAGIRHKDYNDFVFKNSLQVIPVANTGAGKSTNTQNFREGFGKVLYDEFEYYKKYERSNKNIESKCIVIEQGTNADVKKEMFRADRNNDTPVMYTQCSEVGLFRKQQNSPHGGLDFEIMKNGYDGDKFECGTASNDGVSGFIPKLYLSVNVSATPSAIRSCTPVGAFTDGTVNRMCFCFFKKPIIINAITGRKEKKKVMAQQYDTEAITKYVEWARKQSGMLDFAEIFGFEGDENNAIYEYIDVIDTVEYEYLSDLTERNYVSAMRVVREYYLMDLYEKGYNLIEHEGKTKVVKDNVITDMPKAEPWMIGLVKTCYEYFVYGANQLFGRKAAAYHAKNNDIDSGSKVKKLMYKEVYDALPETFTREQLNETALKIKGITNVGKNLVGNWNKNKVWVFDDATKMYTKV